ncbi:hypothetical protein E8E13_001655 [Curvularia kusanoi]|uniref:Carboxylic ester hydrolase n=1 Tax=Curvularia kusanoi TaxID=90978 RepID=A0A9P4W3U3_CURKU|nr:hypothetical protein E8E13_001655 [Curvularia kusanoi]
MSYKEELHIFHAGELGYLEGLTVSSNGKPAVRYFGGIPYALPPTGPHRFRAPRNLPPDYRYSTATKIGCFKGSAAICPQPPSRRLLDTSKVSEDCLQLNIWIPARSAPKDGWPVLFYIHGGYLQWGSPNWTAKALVPLLSDSAFEGLVVMPAYRLNALGFLTGSELAEEARAAGEERVGNMGCWDQRAALEWTYRNIAYFGGDKANITVGGYSAGALSTFYQLSYELYHVASSDAIIKRIIMFSNSPGVLPKTLAQHQKQFDEFVTRLEIPLSITSKEKLRRLREIPYERLIEIQSKMEISEFRTVSDGLFCPDKVFDHLNSGDFASRMRTRKIKLLSGECRDEHTMYRLWRTPGDSYEAVHARLCAEYPEEVAGKLMHIYCNDERSLPPRFRSWQELFGHIYADVQVHNLQRGFHNALFKGGLLPGRDVLRYRFDKRLGGVDESVLPEWGVTHSTDVPIWFWGLDFPGGLTDEEKNQLRHWNANFGAFVKGDDVEWGTTTPTQMRRWRSDGMTDVWEDGRWAEGLKVWDILNGKGTTS